MVSNNLIKQGVRLDNAYFFNQLKTKQNEQRRND